MRIRSTSEGDRGEGRRRGRHILYGQPLVRNPGSASGRKRALASESALNFSPTKYSSPPLLLTSNTTLSGSDFENLKNRLYFIYLIHSVDGTYRGRLILLLFARWARLAVQVFQTSFQNFIQLVSIFMADWRAIHGVTWSRGACEGGSVTCCRLATVDSFEGEHFED